MTFALEWSGEGRSCLCHSPYPVRAPAEQMLVWLLCPSTPHAFSILFV